MNDDILLGFTKAGRDLLHIRDRNEQQDIQTAINTLESQWKIIACTAPIRLLRLQFGRIESIIVKELESAEKELNEELKELERQRDTAEILQRHNDRFQSTKFHQTMEVHLKEVRSYANDIRTQEQGQTLIKPENAQIDQRASKLTNYWTNMQTKIDNVKRKLQTIPKKWQDFEEK